MLRLISVIKPYSKYLLAAWLLTIPIVSSIPSIPVLKIETGKTVIRLDYLIHICVYGLLAFLAFLTSADEVFRISLKRYLLLMAGLILFSLANEYHQKFIPGRSFNVKDIYSNLIGIVAALVFCVVVFRYLQRKLL